MVANNPMATRSSLELMLEKLQQLDDHHKDVPPALPVRPVSRARLPRARKPLELDFQRGNSEGKDSSFKWGGFESKRMMKEAVMGSSVAALAIERVQFDSFQNGIEILGNSREKAGKGVFSIQKCYRGHKVRCYYLELRRGVTTLQSFVRGENARRNYHYRTKRLKAIILIQKQTRNYLNSGCRNGRHSSEIEPRLRENQTGETRVPYRFLVDLEKQVLRAEAKVRQKNEENNALKMQFQELENKWHQYEERMKSMEKMWQDQFTHIQKCLAAAKKKHPDANITTAIPKGRRLGFPTNSFDQCEFLCNFHEDGGEQISQNLCTHEELHKLKLRFKAWKKDYKNKLREAQSTLKKLGNSEPAKRQKSWWAKLS
ncbi:hypothetical protein CDL12_08768 [Handroanthus impetiginosus]|uniref:Uncharacterized protein n=1 Tax=Handroanthus impetiginosus TaxID=429701 RepID=A0A2G9HM28_9LAMI|nr:hypothetical protein CDL12_08768 [Handroanthus impetiginosus]